MSRFTMTSSSSSSLYNITYVIYILIDTHFTLFKTLSFKLLQPSKCVLKKHRVTKDFSRSEMPFIFLHWIVATLFYKVYAYNKYTF